MNNQNLKLPKWPLVVLIAFIVFCTIAGPVCRSLYTYHFVKRSDKQLAEFLKGDLEKLSLYDSEKAFVFIGSLEELTNASCIDLSKDDSFIYSIFDIKDTQNLSTVESSIAISDYLNDLGFAISPISQELFDMYEDEITEVLPIEKTFPWYNSIVETEHFVIIQLS